MLGGAGWAGAGRVLAGGLGSLRARAAAGSATVLLCAKRLVVCWAELSGLCLLECCGAA